MSLRVIEGFHGHLGPYVVLGYKMGFIANLKLGRDPFAKNAVSMTGSKPPMSCMMDGVQLSAGCTLGKGNITVEDRGEPRVVFSSKDGSRSCAIALRAEVTELIDAVDTKRRGRGTGKTTFRNGGRGAVRDK